MADGPDPLKVIATWPDVAVGDAIDRMQPRDAKFWEDTARDMAAWAAIHVKETN